mmetsp:Transcript_35770/g.70234  ORF Transcript_35770/g.70234 Transcript_35770/m.70234 type:complete len:222 (+) Transcript_35770:1496-2161(+)
MKANPSRCCTLALSDSTVSSGLTLHRFCSTISPPSTDSSTQWIVQPVSGTLASRTSWWTFVSMPPAKAGRSDGCTFSTLSFHWSVNCLLRMRMNPIKSTKSTLACWSTAVTSVSKASLLLPLLPTCTARTPAALALSRMPADSTLLITTSTVALSSLAATAASTACRSVPLVLPSTPSLTQPPSFSSPGGAEAGGETGGESALAAMSRRNCAPGNRILDTP